MRIRYSLAIAIGLIFGLESIAQDSIPKGTARLDQLLSEDKIEEASTTLNEHLEYLQSNDQIDSLADYAYYVGKIEMLKSDKLKALNKAESYVTDFKTLTKNPAALRSIHMSMAGFYDLLGMPDKGYSNNEQALEYTLAIPDVKGKEVATIQGNLGTSALRLGNIKQAVLHFRKAIKFYDSDPETSGTDYYFGYTSMGTTMYYASKIDSSIFYYQKAIDKVSTLDSTPLNMHYRPAILLNNIAGLYSMDGNTTRSLEAMKSSIHHYSSFMKSDAEDYKRKDAMKGKFQAIDNIAGIYQSLGDYHKAHELLTYSYEEKQKNYENDNPEIFKSKILIGQAEFTLLNYTKAAQYLDEGIALIKENAGSFSTWNADAHFTRAQIFEKLNDSVKASNYYNLSESYYDKAFENYFDPSYLDFMKKASLFYAKQNDQLKAISTSQKGYDYVIKHQGNNTLSAFDHTLNLGEVYYSLKNYQKSYFYSNEALSILQNQRLQKENALDSIRVQFKKPAALLLQSKSNYILKQEKDTVFLISLYRKLDSAINILDRRKTIISDAKSVTLLISENNDVYDFAKKISLELYQKTGNKKYLDKTLGYHESNIYNRIRARLNSKEAIRFSKIPENVLEEERTLKDNLSESLNGSDSSIESYFEANKGWGNYKKKIQNEYPNYYQMRYGSVNKTLKEIQGYVPENSTLVKYIFIDSKLNAFVITASDIVFVELASIGLEEQIATLQRGSHNELEITELLNDLYLKLWKPFEDKVITEQVFIIPDGVLHNLSFESLTPNKIGTFKSLANNSLLTKHSISYNFNLSFVSQKNNPATYHENYIGFAPGFNDEMKQSYALAAKDSDDIDKGYITLLPQPFSIDLIKEAIKLLGGKSFLDINSTEENFKSKATGHKIIHIGTHAESNNISPELSRLIFAKDTNKETDNYLYNYEIYNCDLDTNLAVLTACETGKPTHQPGEGMISLAHAFNYAGSESMLTSLWKIDEKASTEIVEYFYINLRDGLSKSKALKEAKLKYLRKAEGRTLAPQYWAGLVLIGDTEPIELASKFQWGYGLIAAGALLLLFVFFRKKRLG